VGTARLTSIAIWKNLTALPSCSPQLAVEMVRTMKLPLGVVINRAGLNDGRIRQYCRIHNIEVLAEIPDDRRVAEA
jgi:MinD superfamily P-loop ATPase